jgi:hypothetical protein
MASPAARRALALALTLAFPLASTPARAFDPFEIQVYDGATNQSGEASLELHTNYHHAPSRPAPDAPELPSGKQLHFTLEPALGVTSFWELGAYLQLATRFGDGTYWGGAKLRSKLVTPEGWSEHWTLGINYEVGFLPSKFDADRYGGEIRPILGFESRFVKFAVNPNVELGFAGAGLREGPELTPAAALYGRIPDVIDLGVEYYASMGPMRELPAWKQQEHYVFAATNVLALEGWEINAGAGFGLTENSDAFIAKLILGHSIGRLWGGERGTVAPRTPLGLFARR